MSRPIIATVGDNGHLPEMIRLAIAGRLRRYTGKAVSIEIKAYRRKRSSQQNRRYFALLTLGCRELGWEVREKDRLHDEIAHLLLPLPPCPITGIRRRQRTPNLETVEFNTYMDDVARTLINFGADLTDWDEEERRAAA